MDPFERLKDASKWMWSLGDYRDVARYLQPHAETLAAAADIQPGMDVLDVAAGNGNFAIAAAERGAHVTASDFSPKMIELGRARTAAEGIDIDWQEADAEELPFRDGSYDVAASVFGAMFAPRPERVAAELFRVVKPGGLVAMANYADEGFLGSFADLLVKYSLAPSAGAELPSPFEWGDPAVVRHRFDGKASSLRLEARIVRFAFPSVDAGFAFWERTNPPLMALQMMLPPERYQLLRTEGAGLMWTMNVASDGRLALDSEYLSVVALKGRR
ncbi:MAG TPA: methyltransferase domain-containing protein [Candidatus Dormibacteraeota bacterium]|nr:methyltransferase domain-containing protein [Candidatus Dormibacteraeota bacterium]